MSAISGFRFLWLAYAAKPVADRRIYRAIRKRQLTSVLEIGVHSLERAELIVGVCQRYAADQPVRYAAVDWFEERGEGLPPVSLIQAHRRLNATGAKVRVAPGGPAAVEAVANSLPRMDLILISADVRDEQLSRAWFFVPRMCHPDTIILRGRPMGGSDFSYELIDQQAVAGDAARASRPRAA